MELGGYCISIVTENCMLALTISPKKAISDIKMNVHPHANNNQQIYNKNKLFRDDRERQDSKTFPLTLYALRYCNESMTAPPKNKEKTFPSTNYMHSRTATRV